VLAALALLFLLRVLGQALAAFAHVAWLPAMSAWYSGLVPYPVLLPAQAVLLGLLAWICADVARGAGWWARPRPRLAAWLPPLAIGYARVMLLR